MFKLDMTLHNKESTFSRDIEVLVFMRLYHSSLVTQWQIQDFPLGGHQPVGGGGANLRRVHFLAKMYVKTKEIDPVGGACRGAPLDPPMVWYISSQ